MTGWRIGVYVSIGTLDYPKDIVIQGHRKMEAANCACKSYLHSPSLRYMPESRKIFQVLWNYERSRTVKLKYL